MNKKNFCIYPADHSLYKKWFIKYYTIDLLTDIRTYYKAYGNINSFHTVPERLAAAAKLIEHLQNGTQEPRPAKFFELSAALLSKLNDRRKRVNDKTQQRYTYQINHFISWLKLQRRVDAEKYLASLAAAGLTPTTVNHYRNTLKSFFDWIGLRNENPFRLVQKYREMRIHGRFFNEEQLPVVKAAIVTKYPALWIACKYLFYLFIRPTELRQMKIEHLNLVAETATVFEITSKVKKSRTVNIPAPMLKMLIDEIHIKDFPAHFYLVSNSGFPGEQQSGPTIFYKQHRKVMKQLRFSRGYYFYSWKHTGNYFAVRAGVSAKEIQLHNGHTTLQTTDNYLATIRANDLTLIKKLPAI